MDRNLEQPKEKSHSIKAIRIGNHEHEPKRRSWAGEGYEFTMMTENSSASNKDGDPPAKAKATVTIETGPDKNINRAGENYNWWWHKLRKPYAKEALSSSKWRDSGSTKTRTANVNKQNNGASSVRVYTSKRGDMQRKHEMNKLIAKDLEELHLSTWTRIYPETKNRNSPTAQASTNPRRATRPPITIPQNATYACE